MHAGMIRAIGPAMPMSKSAARDGIGPLMRMKAPSVPIQAGKRQRSTVALRIRDRGGRKGSVHLVRQQNKHQRMEMEGQAQLGRMHNRTNGTVAAVIAKPENRLLMFKIELDTGSHRHGGDESRKQQHNVDPEPGVVAAG